MNVYVQVHTCSGDMRVCAFGFVFGSEYASVTSGGVSAVSVRAFMSGCSWECEGDGGLSGNVCEVCGRVCTRGGHVSGTSLVCVCEGVCKGRKARPASLTVASRARLCEGGSLLKRVEWERGCR
jgi:hypothetical protein